MKIITKFARQGDNLGSNVLDGSLLNCHNSVGQMIAVTCFVIYTSNALF